METILIIIAVILALQLFADVFFNVTARMLNIKRYNENKKNEKEVKPLEEQLDLMNTTLLNTANELMQWKQAYANLDAQVKERDELIEKMKAERDLESRGKAYNSSE